MGFATFQYSSIMAKADMQDLKHFLLLFPNKSTRTQVMFRVTKKCILLVTAAVT